MDIRTLKKDAARLSADGKRLALIHCGVSVGASAILALVTWLLDTQIAKTTGLGGMGTRAALSSAQTVLQLAFSILLPFWSLGYLRIALLHARGQQPEISDLPEGLRRWAPALRTMLLRLAGAMVITIAAVQIASTLYAFTPASDKLMVAMEEFLTSAEALDQAAIESLIKMLLPVYGLGMVLSCVVLIPLLYRFRLAEISIMDDQKGALAAMKMSSRLMHRNRLSFLKLDLSFWWYYLLEALAIALGYGNLLLPTLGIAINEQLSYYLFYGLSLVAQLLIFWQFAPRVQTAYALAYHTERQLRLPEDNQ